MGILHPSEQLPDGAVCASRQNVGRSSIDSTYGKQPFISTFSRVGGGTPTRFGGFEPSPLDRVQGSNLLYVMWPQRRPVERRGWTPYSVEPVIDDPLLGHHRDRAADARGPAQSSIGCEQIAVEEFCQRDVRGVVDRQVVP
jgi:hypothetical protein